MVIFLLIYIALSVGAAIWISKKVNTVQDFALAGRQLPFHLSLAAVFATWFGSETILGSTDEFAKNGIQGLIEEPLGAGICLLLISLFYAKHYYNLPHITINDLFRDRFGERAERVSAWIMIPSFFTWISAQLVAIAHILSVFFPYSLTINLIVAGIIILLFTVFGGMWSVAFTDFIQSFIIVICLIFVFFYLYQSTNEADKIAHILKEKTPDMYEFFPTKGKSWADWFAAWVTVSLGSIVSQDVYQRVNASNSLKNAKKATLYAGLLYLVIAIIPIGIVLFGNKNGVDWESSSPLIVQIIQNQTPPIIRMLFFSALMAAILSTASGALLAPATVLSENVIYPLYPNMSEKRQLQTVRISTVIILVISLSITFFQESIFDLVSLSSAFGLVGLFVPFTCALIGNWMTKSAAIWSMIGGMLAWAVAEYLDPEFPSIFWGLLFAVIFLLLGLWYDKTFDKQTTDNK